MHEPEFLFKIGLLAWCVVSDQPVQPQWLQNPVDFLSRPQLREKGYTQSPQGGGGGFSPITLNGPSVLLGSNAYGLAAMTIADFNHDGYPDLGISVENELFVSTGPTFNSPVQAQGFVAGYPTNYPGSVAVADFNNDGWPDVVSTTSYGISRLYNVPVPMVTPGVLTFSGAGTQRVTVKNTLKTSQAITAGLLTPLTGGSTPFRISSNTCGTLAAGASCTITVEYSGSTTNTATLYVSANGQYIAAIPISGS